MKRKPLRLAAAASPQSIQSQVLDAVVALLGGESGNVFRCRFEPFTAAELPADNVLPENEEASYEDTGSIDIRHRFVIRHTAQASSQVDVAVDPRYVAAQQLLLADPLLGGLVLFTRYVGRKWEFEKGEVDTVALVVTYEVQFSTSRSDPSQRGL